MTPDRYVNFYIKNNVKELDQRITVALRKYLSREDTYAHIISYELDNSYKEPLCKFKIAYGVDGPDENKSYTHIKNIRVTINSTTDKIVTKFCRLIMKDISTFLTFPYIITVSGSAQHGKDTLATYMCRNFNKKGHKTIVFHYADFLKFSAKQWFNWNGEKDERGRSLLQHLGTDICRRNNELVWVNMAKEFIKSLGKTFEYIIIPDCRFKNEINPLGIQYSKALHIYRPDFDNGLTEEQKNHPSENDLNDYNFDIGIVNDSNLANLGIKASGLCGSIIDEAEIYRFCNWEKLRELQQAFKKETVEEDEDE